MEEIWKDIEGYEGYYQVSNLGNVKGLARKINNGKGVLVKKESMLNHINSRDGYLYVALSKNNKERKFSVHRLVAKAFIPNPNNLPEVNHKDEVKTNNFVFVNEDGTVDYDKSNLEWCTRKYNVNYGTARKRLVETRTVNNSYGAEIPVNQFDLNGNFIKRYKSMRSAARETGLAEPLIEACCNGKRNKCGGFVFLKDKDIHKLDEHLNPPIPNAKRIGQYDLDGNLIKIWNSGMEVRRTLGVNSGWLSLCCNGKGGAKTAKGFVWKFV